MFSGVSGRLLIEQTWSDLSSCAPERQFKALLVPSQVCLTSASPRTEVPKGDHHT